MITTFILSYLFVSSVVLVMFSCWFPADFRMIDLKPTWFRVLGITILLPTVILVSWVLLAIDCLSGCLPPSALAEFWVELPGEVWLAMKGRA